MQFINDKSDTLINDIKNKSDQVIKELTNEKSN